MKIGLVIYKAGSQVGELFKGSERFSVKFEEYEVFAEDIKGSEIFGGFSMPNIMKIKLLNP